VILATGSSPRELKGFAFDEKRILSSTGALMLQKLPESLLILGSGAIGVEFAHIMNAFGVTVHLVEMLDRILPLEDDDCIDVLAKSFKKRGIKLYTATKAMSQQEVDGKLQVLLEDKDGKQTTVTVDQLLVSAGRVPNTANLGLAEAASSWMAAASSKSAITARPVSPASMRSVTSCARHCWPMSPPGRVKLPPNTSPGAKQNRAST
jgi:dihydrolipoamide dehydrogenase